MSNMKWIKTTEKLPNENVKVLVIAKRIVAGIMYKEVAYYQKGKWWNDLIGEIEGPGTGDEYFKVTHWMELPDPPKD